MAGGREAGFLPHGAVLCVFLLSALTFALAAPHMLGDPDTAWHIAAGDLIRELGALPPRDPWSFTSGDTRWLNMSWGWDVLVSWLHEKGGLPLLVAAHILTGALALSLAAWAAMRRGAGTIATLIACIWAMLLVVPSLCVRSYHFTYLFLVLFHLVLHGVHTGRMRKRWLALLPLLLAAWANFHGGFLLAATLLGAYGLAALMARDFRLLATLALAGLACVAATCATPLGADIFEIAARTRDSALVAIVGEWRALRFSPEALPTLGYMLAVLWLVNPLRRNILFAESLLILFWMGMGIFSVRHLPVFALISVPAFAWALHGMLMKISALLARREEAYAYALGSRRARGALAVIAGVMIVTLAGGGLRALHPGLHFAASIRPDEEISYILDHYPGRRFLTFYDYGGYILYAARGKLQPFIDGRGEAAYPPQLVRDYVAFSRQTPGWEKIFEKYRIDGLLLPKGLPAMAPERYPAFSRVHSGPVAHVFVRKTKGLYY